MQRVAVAYRREQREWGLIWFEKGDGYRWVSITNAAAGFYQAGCEVEWIFERWSVEELKPKCTYHLDRHSIVNLDGDELCGECADNWVRGEGDYFHYMEQLEQEHGA